MTDHTLQVLQRVVKISNFPQDNLNVVGPYVDDGIVSCSLIIIIIILVACVCVCVFVFY